MDQLTDIRILIGFFDGFLNDEIGELFDLRTEINVPT